MSCHNCGHGDSAGPALLPRVWGAPGRRLHGVEERPCRSGPGSVRNVGTPTTGRARRTRTIRRRRRRTMAAQIQAGRRMPSPSAASSASCSPTSSASPPFAEGRDAEDVRELLRRYFEPAREVIERYGGTVEKFIGDAVMAVWGAPVAHEDDAERAVRAALDLVDAVAAARPEGMPEARAGVLTGEAAVTLGADGPGDGRRRHGQHREPAPVGGASPATVLVGEATQRAAERRDRLRARRRAGAQGQGSARSPPGARSASSPSAAARGRTDGARAAVRRPRRGAPPAQGPVPRHRARAAAPARLASSGRRASASAAWPGSSTSTSTALVETVWWHHGRCPPTARASRSGRSARWSARAPASPRRDDEADDPRASSPRRSPSTSPTRPSGAGSSRALLRPARARGRRRRPGARSCSRPGARSSSGSPTQAPVVLVFEDLQWADDGLLDFIDHLLEWSRTHPILVVTLARPELLDRRPDWGAGQRNFTRSTSSRSPTTRCASCWPASCRACRRAAATRSSPGPTASRCTRSRPSGCSSPRAGSSARDGVVPAGRRPRRPRGARDAPRPHRRAARRARPGGPVARSRTRAVLGQSFTPAALAAVPERRRADLEPRLRGARPARAPRSRRRPALARARPVRVRPGAHPRGRLRTLAQARPRGPPPRRRALLRDARRRGAGRRPGRPLPGRLPSARPGPRPTRSPPRPGWRSAARRIGRPSSARSTRRCRTSSRPWR